MPCLITSAIFNFTSRSTQHVCMHICVCAASFGKTGFTCTTSWPHHHICQTEIVSGNRNACIPHPYTVLYVCACVCAHAIAHVMKLSKLRGIYKSSEKLIDRPTLGSPRHRCLRHDPISVIGRLAIFTFYSIQT